MTQLWAVFCDTHSDLREWLDSENYLGGEETPNVEEVLSALNADLASVLRRGAEDKTLLEARNALYRAVIQASLLNQRFWEKPYDAIWDPSLDQHRSLLSKLIGVREVRQPAPAIFSTNYDLALEWAADTLDLRYYNGFDGVHLRQFSPQNFDLQLYNSSARGLARFGVYGFALIKLHGSLSWRYEGSRAIESPTPIAIQELDKFISEEVVDLADRLMIFPSSGKYADTTQYIYGELFRRFADFLATPQTCLIVSGYSFRDDHINRLIETGLNTPSLQLVLYLPEVAIDENGSMSNLSKRAESIVRRAGPRCTVVANGNRAYFEAMVGDLPGTPQVQPEGAPR
jgi:hypothetical protein